MARKIARIAMKRGITWVRIAELAKGSRNRGADSSRRKTARQLFIRDGCPSPCLLARSTTAPDTNRMGTSRDDIRYALRRIRREPGFAAFAVAIIAIGVAAVTSVFSVMSPLMLRPLPFAQQDRRVWIAKSASGGMSAVTSRTSNLRDYRIYNRSFEALTGFYAFFDYGSYNLVGDGAPERLIGVGVAQDFLQVLGVRPLLGRNFTHEESIWGGRHAAILTHGFWTRRFGADPNIVGRSISLSGEPTEIVGVLPERFDFAS